MDFGQTQHINILKKSKGIVRVITAHSEGDKNVWPAFYNKPSNSWQNILILTTNVNLVAPDERSGDHQVCSIHRQGNINVFTEFCVNLSNS